MKGLCRWKEDEIKKLFSFVEENVKKGVTLTKIFTLYANDSGRKPNSVRNYYYAELSNLEQNKEQAQKLNINLKYHQKNNPQIFSQEETSQILNEIENLKKKGYSVRKACLTLAGGDIVKMVRLQNKYRTETKNKTQEAPMPQNIISITDKRMKLSDVEINSLFLGLVKLIKASARQELNIKSQKETQDANELLRQTIVRLNNKEQQLIKLKKTLELLKTENQKLDEKIKNLRVKKVKEENVKMAALKNYTFESLGKKKLKNKNNA